MRNALHQLLLYYSLIVLAFISCNNSGTEQRAIFKNITTTSCSSTINDEALLFSNFQFAPHSTKVNGKAYYEISSDNAMGIRGFLRQEKQVIYFLQKESGASEQKLFDFNAKVKDHWQVVYKDSKVEKYTFLESKYDKSIDDTLFLYHIKLVSSKYPTPSHHKSLVYLWIGKKKGIIAGYYTGYNGYTVQEFYPRCRAYMLSYEMSSALDDRWGN